MAELLAALVALEVFGHFRKAAKPQRVVLEAGTDNLATEHVTRKGASNKFPLSFVQMQLGLKCYFHGLVFQLKWRPRETNVEADDLTNQRYDKFNPERRCPVEWQDLDLTILEELMKYRAEVQGWKEERKRLGPATSKLSKRQKMETKSKW